MRSLFSTAQKAPAAWLGTVLPLEIDKDYEPPKGKRWGLNLLYIVAVVLRAIDTAVCGVGTTCLHENVDSLDVGDHGDDAAREEQDEGDDAQTPNDVEANESIYFIHQSVG